MGLKLKETYCDHETLLGIVRELGDAVIKAHPSFRHVVFMGILQGGAPVAEFLAEYIQSRTGARIPVAFVDITLYRDDHIYSTRDPVTHGTEVPFTIKHKKILLVDDVLFTGRTVRAALTAILSIGRPQYIRMAAVIDRGGRELPIHADYVGRTLDLSKDQGVRVRLNPTDGQPGGVFVDEDDGDQG